MNKYEAQMFLRIDRRRKIALLFFRAFHSLRIHIVISAEKNGTVFGTVFVKS
jgi:hypothetical protein